MDEKSLVCKKKDIYLYKIEKNNKIYFEIESIITNNNIIIKNLVNFKLFDLMAELNKDIIEKHETLSAIDNYIDVLFIFKNFSDDLGINKHYFTTRTHMLKYDNSTIFKSEHLDVTNYNLNLDLSNYSLIKDSNNSLEFNYINTHSMKCKYSFSMELEDELPSYMENMLGLIMKKVIFRLKTFIENI